MGKGQFFQQMVLGKLHIHMQKNETGPLFYTEPKNLTVDQRPNTALEENREEKKREREKERKKEKHPEASVFVHLNCCF